MTETLHADTATDDDTPPKAAYAHRPKPIGGEVGFRLFDRNLAVHSMNKIDTIWLGAVSSIQLLYAPNNFSRHAFKITLRMSDGRSVSFTNVSWKGLANVEQQDEAYNTFVRTLIADIAQANPQVKLIAGRGVWPWRIMAGFTAVALVGMVGFVLRALTLGEYPAAFFAALVVAGAVWQMEPFVRRNRPRAFTPDNLPADLLP